MRWIFYCLGAILIVAIGIGLFFLRLMYDSGAFSEITTHFEGTCARYAGFDGGTEDLTIDHETGWVFVSSYDRRAEIFQNGQHRGRIEAFQLGNLDAGIIDLTPATPADFRPHGVSLYDGPEGMRLFVISHQGDGTQAIELFDVAYGARGVPSLAHVDTLSDPLIVSPNDLVAVGPRSFYTTNDFTTRDREGLNYSLELFGRLNRTTLVHFDDGRASIAAHGLTYANGVNVSPDGRTLYLTELTDGTLRIYDRDIATGALRLRTGTDGLMRIGTGPDNIDIDAMGRVWVASHPRLFDIGPHMETPANLSPARVSMLTPSENGSDSVVEVYLGSGVLASGSSVAAYHNGQMVIGVIFDKHVVICDVADPRVNGASN